MGTAMRSAHTIRPYVPMASLWTCPRTRMWMRFSFDPFCRQTRLEALKLVELPRTSSRSWQWLDFEMAPESIFGIVDLADAYSQNASACIRVCTADQAMHVQLAWPEHQSTYGS